MITSIKTLPSGNTVTIRTDIEGKQDCSVVRCEFTGKPSKEDKEQASELAATVVANTKFKGESKLEFVQV